MRLALVAGVTYPVTLAGDNSQREQLKGDESRVWARLQSQGRRVKDLRNDRIENAWLRSTLLKPSVHAKALRLRTNPCGTKVACRRADPTVD